MRIVSGKYKGRKLFTPTDTSIRPTSDKIRGAIFNVLRHQNILQDATALDVFCGTGALGLEALSNGARTCTFIDKYKSSLNLARKNAAHLEAEVFCSFLLSDAKKLKKRDEDIHLANLVFMDPPYNKGLPAIVLKQLIEENWLTDEAMIVLESEKNYDLPVIKNLQIEKINAYGDTKIQFLSYSYA